MISGVGFGCFSTTTGLESAGKKQLNPTVPELIENLRIFLCNMTEVYAGAHHDPLIKILSAPKLQQKNEMPFLLVRPLYVKANLDRKARFTKTDLSGASVLC